MAVKVDLAALGGATSFPIWPCGRFQLAELTNLVGADMKKSMRDGYGSQQAELTYIYIYMVTPPMIHPNDFIW